MIGHDHTLQRYAFRLPGFFVLLTPSSRHSNATELRRARLMYARQKTIDIDTSNAFNGSYRIFTVYRFFNTVDASAFPAIRHTSTSHRRMAVISPSRFSKHRSMVWRTDFRFSSHVHD